MQSPIVPPEVQFAVKEMYEERDSRGRRLWSHAMVGKKLGLSETTVYRIVNGLGAYQGADRFKTGAALADAAKASAAKLLELLKATGADQAQTQADETKPADDLATAKAKRYLTGG
jgi:hypothetical protein